MDNLKKNLHFAVLGGGVLLGVILVVVGIMIRAGTEQELVDKNDALKRHVNVYSKGTLDDVERRADRFDASVEEASKALAAATGFDTGYTEHGAGGSFYTNEANAGLRNLRERWAKLEGKNKMPKLVSGWTMKRLSGNENANAFWDKIAGDVGSPPVERIRDLQRQLRILEEVVTTCERLVAAGLDQGMGVKLLDFKSDTYQALTSNKLDSPWMAMQWEMDLECAPGFAALLFEELANPSALTMAEKEGMAKRRGFTMLPMILQTEMVERQGQLKVVIENEEKAGLLQILREAGKQVPDVSDPPNLDPNSSEGKRVVEAAVELLQGEEQIVLPVRAGIRMRAAAYNSEWRATNAPEGTD